MKKTEDNKTYLSIKECAEVVSRSGVYICNLCRQGKVDCYKDGRGYYRVNINSLNNYIFRKTYPEATKPWISGTFTVLEGYDYRYAVNNDTGEIVNLDFRNILTPSPNKEKYPYYQVMLVKNGKPSFVLVSKIVADALLPNKRGCNEVHHIDGNTENNKPDNLLHTFKGYEHDTLDKLRKDPSKKREYMQMVRKIQKLNSEGVYKVLDPEFDQSGNYYYYLYLTKKGYRNFKAEKPIDPKDIVLARVELKS